MTEAAENRVALIEKLLTDALQPSHLLVRDQSHLHAGHAGAQSGMGHYAAHIVADAFDGLSRIQRHQKVYAILGDLMKTDIHAISLNTQTTGESSE